MRARNTRGAGFEKAIGKLSPVILISSKGHSRQNIQELTCKCLKTEMKGCPTVIEIACWVSHCALSCPFKKMTLTAMHFASVARSDETPPKCSIRSPAASPPCCAGDPAATCSTAIVQIDHLMQICYKILQIASE